MSIDSEVRNSKLAERVEEIEKLLRSGAHATGVSLASLLNTAQAQLDANRLEDEQAQNDKKEKEAKDRSAFSRMVEREEKLNKEEKDQYARFLSREYFTRTDFKDMDKFYSQSWDKLSEEGKAEMDKRVYEGARRGHYEIDELPVSVKERVSGRSQRSLEKSSKESLSEPLRDNKSGSYQTESPILGDSVRQVKEPDRDAKKAEPAAKPDIPEGLAGLSKLSPVQETDSVVVPQTERGGQGNVRGG